MKQLFKTFAAAGLVAAFVSVSQAQPYYAAGALLTPSWNASDPATELIGGPTVYSNTLPSSANTIYEFKIAASGWSANWPAGNAKIKGDANGTNTFYFYPGAIIDGWQPLANRVGYADPGNMTWGVAGDFDGWDGTQLLLASIGNGVFSNNIVVTSAGNHQFKFQSPPGSWSDVYFGADFQNGGNNGSFSTTNSPQTVPVVLDLPHGRWVVGQLAPPPVTNYVVFAVDMSSQILLGKFDPSVDGVFVSGAFNSWPGTGTGALVLTNVPTYGGGSNTNIYYATNLFIGTPGSLGTAYKFTCNNAANSANSGYEPRSGDRTFNLLSNNGALVLPVVSFGDVYTSDYLTANTMVTFSVNMTNAHTYAAYTPSNNFDATSMNVYITGNFDDTGWAPSPWAIPNMRQMTETPTGSRIYTYTHTVLAGHPVDIHYKYGYDDGVNNLDNEAPAYQDHVRVVRLTATGSYTMPTDTFGNQHVEPSMNMVSITPAGGGNVSVKWLGRPGVKLQKSGSVSGGSWSSYDATDGSTWTGTTNITSDGWACSTNLPAGGSAGFFRLVKPN